MKPKPPAPAQVKAEIAKLNALKDTIRHMTAFGDDNREACQAQIDTLEHSYDDDQVEEHYGRSEDYPAAPANVCDAALEAVRWLAGEERDAPSDGWKSLEEKR